MGDCRYLGGLYRDANRDLFQRRFRHEYFGTQLSPKQYDDPRDDPDRLIDDEDVNEFWRTASFPYINTRHIFRAGD